MIDRLKLLPFFLASGLFCFLAFPGAFTGQSLLAPLDIFPNCFEHFRFMDPAAAGVPANHHMIDQATYDLPLQYRIYESLQKGIVPWWDPYTYGGRPLLADAHVNGTDPVRLLCYFLFPFPVAYNLNLLLKSVLTGLGMWVLLRHLGHAWLLSLSLALSFQFAGCFALFFGHPWIQASFLFYPFLWLSWDRLVAGPTRGTWLAASLLCALIFLCGNLQSHAYLACFALFFTWSSFYDSRPKGLRTLWCTSLSVGWGTLLAAPVLLNQIEFFLCSARKVTPDHWPWVGVFRGPLSLSAIFPWLLGTFRTVDLSKAVGSGSLGFSLFVGTVPFALAILGLVIMVGRKIRPTHADRIALICVGGYLMQISTPLGNLFYNRMSPLACMGLIVIAASTVSWISGHDAAPQGVAARWLVWGSCLLLVLWLGELFLFHQFHHHIESFFWKETAAHPSSITSPALRSFQIRSFPVEVGPANPEILLSWLSLFLLIVGTRFSRPMGRRLIHGALALSLAGLFLFYARFTPCQPVSQWEKLREGGPVHQQIFACPAWKQARFYEETTLFQERVFPNALAALYGVHVVHGYSALQPESLFFHLTPPLVFPPSWVADWKISRHGQITLFSPDHRSGETCRLIWEGSPERKITILDETANRLLLELSPGWSGRVIRTDTFFPGWQLRDKKGSSPLQKLDPCFGLSNLPAHDAVTSLSYVYLPQTFWAGLFCCALGAIGVLIIDPIGRRFRFYQPL